MTLRWLFNRNWFYITALVIVATLVCARLGIWQLDRLSQRRVFNAHVLAMRTAPILVLPSNADVKTMEYRAATASGTYDYDHEVAIRNQMHDNQYGYHLLTPLRVSDNAGGSASRGSVILVDRGWIPADGNATPDSWREYDGPGSVVVRGVIRLSQIPPPFGAAAEPTLSPGQTWRDFWIYLDVNRIGGQLPYPILPVYLEVSRTSGSTTPPIPTEVELDLSEGPHMGYAIQWFSFALLMLVGYPFYVRRQEEKQK